MTVNSTSKCKIWIPDRSASDNVSKWLDNRLSVEDIKGELIDVDLNHTLDRATDDKEVDFAPPIYEDIHLMDLYGDLPLGRTMSGQVTIREDKVPKISDSLPLPPYYQKQPYRTQVLMRLGSAGITEGYMGFHARVIEVDENDPLLWRVMFFSWTNEVLGDAWIKATDAALFDQALTKLSKDQEGPIFVSFKEIGRRSLYFLAGPKVPFGAARAEPSEHRFHAGSILAERQDHLAICGAESDFWLRAVRTQISGCAEAGGPADIEDAIAKSAGTQKSVDLISHSITTDMNSGGIMKLGNLQLTAENIRRLPRSLLERLSKNPLYLVGCYTGVGVAAQEALERMREFGIQAYGTQRPVGLYDFNSNGLLSNRRHNLFAKLQNKTHRYELNDSVMKSAGAIRRSVSEPLRKELSNLLSNVRGTEVTTLEQVLRLDTWFSLPGLLAVPSQSIELLSNVDVEARGELFFGGKLVRISQKRAENQTRHYSSSDSSHAPIKELECLFVLP